MEVSQDKDFDESPADADEVKLLDEGKRILTLADKNDDAEEKRQNEEKAVLCLIKASRKGNEEATNLLRECLKNKKGITKKNHDDVAWCLETSSFEKHVREASRNLFRQLGGTKDPMTYDDYVVAVKERNFDDKKTERLLLAAGKEIGSEITDKKLSKVISEQIQGTINLTSSEREWQSHEFKSADIVTKVLKYPKLTSKIFLEEGIETVSKEGITWVTSAIPTNQLYLLSAFFLYSFISASLFLMVVPLLVFYITLATMCIATLQMILKKSKLQAAKTLAETLQQCSKAVDVDESVSRFARNSLSPYWVFLCTTPIFVASFALANKSYIPCSDLFTMSSVVAAISFFGLAEDYYDPIRWLAVFMNFVAALPTLLHNFPGNLPILSKLVQFTTDAFVTFDTGSGLRMNIGLPSLAYFCIFVLFIAMAAKLSWKGVYRVFLPFLVTQFWLNFATTIFPYTNWFGLLRSSLGNLFLPVLLPLSLVLGSVYGIIGIINSFQSGIFLKLLLTVLIGGIPIVLSQVESVFGIISDKNIKRSVMVAFSVLAIIPLATIDLSGTGDSNVKKIDLSWDRYTKLCIVGNSNRITQQTGCKNFIGQQVVWNGTFQSAKVTEVTNSMEPLLQGLPAFLVKKIRCVYGESFGECDLIQTSELDRAVCEVSKSVGHDCHIHNYDSYSFHFTITVPGFNGKIFVDAGNNFKETLSKLQQGDKVEVTATLGKDQGTFSPVLRLRNIRCFNCQTSDALHYSDEEEDEETYILKSLYKGVSVFVSFFWSPLLEYSS